MGTKRANGEGTIYQLPNGRWRVLLPYAKANGSMGRVSRKVKTRADARAVLDKLRGEVAAGVKMDTEQQTTGEFLLHWLEVEVQPNRAENTHKSYQNAVTKHLNPRIGNIKLKKLTASMISAALARMLTEKVGSRTRQNCYIVLHAALAKAVEWSEIASNPCKKVTRPQTEREEIRPLTLAEVKQLISLVEGDKHDAFYQLAITTGMRQGELFGLHRDAINLSERKLVVRQQATEVWNNVRVKPPKTKASYRTIDLTDTVVQKLRDHFATLDAAGYTGQIAFPNEDGNYLRKGSFSRWSWTRLLKKAGITHRGFHHIRHTAATLMLNAGVPIQVVSRILGHSSPAVTLKIYAHVLPGLEGQARDRIGTLLS